MNEFGAVARVPDAPVQQQAVLGRIARDQVREEPEGGRVDLRATAGAQPVSSDGHSDAAGRRLDVTG